MRDDSANRSVTAVFVTIAILGITVAGVLFSDFYSRLNAPSDKQLASEFDPGRYPSPSAGIAANPVNPLSCDGVIFRTTNDGIKFVRQSGGGVLIGAEYKKKFGYYTMEYGLLAPVDETSFDLTIREKLRYALFNCEGPYTRTGAGF